MGRFFIKPDSEVDFYAVFCSNVDDFLAGGPRAAWDSAPEYEPAPERFERADEFGTSDYLHWYAWDCEQFLLHRGTGTAWWLRRSDVQEYVRRQSAGESVEDLLELIEDDEDDEEPVRSPMTEELKTHHRSQ